MSLTITPDERTGVSIEPFADGIAIGLYRNEDIAGRLQVTDRATALRVAGDIIQTLAPDVFARIQADAGRAAIDYAGADTRSAVALLVNDLRSITGS